MILVPKGVRPLYWKTGRSRLLPRRSRYRVCNKSVTGSLAGKL